MAAVTEPPSAGGPANPTLIRSDDLPDTTAGASSSDSPSQPAVLSSTPVEMSDLSPPLNPQLRPTSRHTPPRNKETTTTAPTSTSKTTATDFTPDSLPPHRRQDSSAIGPASDAPLVPTESTTSSGVTLQITLLLPSGARHPFKLDERYLRRREVDIEEMNPLNMSVYTVKELIWRDWRSEWEPRPSSPAYIRLIYFGAMLDDKQALKECRLNAGSPNVVHMSVKPQEIIEEEDVKHSTKKGSRAGSVADGEGSRCCVIL